MEIRLNTQEYIADLREKFKDTNFKRLEKENGRYITNPIHQSSMNDAALFSETQVKRFLRCFYNTYLTESVKNKLFYFYKNESRSEIYETSQAINLLSEEKYAIQNIGHATQLIQIPGFNILTDPVFYALNPVLYPEMTKSLPVDDLPRIHIILSSHNHLDHTDEKSQRRIVEYYEVKQWEQPMVFVPLGDQKLFEGFGFHKVHEVDWFTKITLVNANYSVNLISIPVDHRSGRRGIDHHKSLVTGWVINPLKENVIFKFAGDTRSLTAINQKAVDAIIWHEIQSKTINSGKNNNDIDIPDIIFMEPSGPNYTRIYMDITHQATSYSALLKFIQCKNLAELSGRSLEDILKKTNTVMIHHNKFELGVDRFNEGLFVMKKLVSYLDLDQDGLRRELQEQQKKLDRSEDYEKLKKNTSLMMRGVICALPRYSSLLVHSKEFIIKDIFNTMNQLGNQFKNEFIKEYVIKNTIFPRIGQRLNNEHIMNTYFDWETVNKYHKRRF